jgi:hypothetical protein
VNKIQWRRLSPVTAIILALLVTVAWVFGGWGLGLVALGTALFSAFCVVVDERR